MKKISGIYAIHNLVTGKKYIGQSIDIFNRSRQHFSELRKNNHHSPCLQNSYNKHGREVFILGIIEECSRDLLNSKEEYWINYFNSYHKGYNATDNIISDHNTKPPTIKEFKIYNKTTLELLGEFKGYDELTNYLNISTNGISKMISRMENVEDRHWFYKSMIIVRSPMTLEKFLNRMKIYQLNTAITRVKEGKRSAYCKTYVERMSKEEFKDSMKLENKRRLEKSGKYKVKVWARDTEEYIGEFISVHYACLELGLNKKQLNKVFYHGRNYYKGYVFEKQY